MADMTMKRAAQAALDAQSACNLSGVVISFARIMHFLCDQGLDTPGRNTHPISRLFAEQISHLTGAGMGDVESWVKAEAECRRLAGAE